MKFSTHLTTGLLLGVNIAPNAILGVACTIGAILPDILDKVWSFGNRDRWSKIHRTGSHNLAYLIPIFICIDYFPHYYSLRSLPLPTINWSVYIFLYYVSIGTLLHVALDFLTPEGIPFFPFLLHERFSFDLVRTNGRIDRAISIISVALLILFVIGLYETDIVRIWFSVVG